MIKKAFIAPLIVTGLFSGACGASKKLEVARGQVIELSDQNKQLKNKVSSLQTDLANCATSYKTATDDLAAYKTECRQIQEKLESAQSVLKEQYNTMHQIENKIDDALTDFKDKGVEVYFKKGLVYVSLEDKLLYKSGSAKLDQGGKDALAHLATVLNGYPNLKVIVLGNTDDVKFKNGMDNWTLSTERANGVVRVLRDACNMDPSRLTAAGKGMYNPIADNTTVEGRSKNRRTDIILNPDLDKLWDNIDR
jgi:chemotaxis protein MotB